MKYPSRDLTFEWGRTAPEQLSREASLLDTKIFSVFIAANVIIAVVVGLARNIQFDLTLIPLTVAFLTFVIIFIRSLMSYQVQQLYVSDSPEILEQDYWEKEPEETKQIYWGYVKEDFDHNLKVVKIKGRTLSLTVPLLAIETIFLILWILLISYQSF
jgi:hypothetical protein